MMHSRASQTEAGALRSTSSTGLVCAQKGPKIYASQFVFQIVRVG